MICSCFFSSNSHVEDLSTLHIDELWMVWMNICQSPVFPLSPLDNHSSRWLDGVNGIFSTFCKAFGEIVRMHLCGILLLEIFLNSPTSRLTAREKRKISFSEDWSLSERALTSSCSILQVSFYFQFLLLKFGLCKKKKTKNTIPRGIKILKSHIIYYHRCKVISCTRLKVIKQQWVTWLWAEILLVILEIETVLWGSKYTLLNH